MPAPKKKKTTKTTKKPAAKSHKKAACRTRCKTITPRERMHIYIVTALSITAGILLCADAAMMIVA